MRFVVIALTLAGVVSPLVAQEGARYLIIARDELVDAIRPLAQWKHDQGIPCRIAPTSETGTTLAQIDQYIANAYNNWPIRPEFVLLVGHPSLIPAARYGQGWTYYSDNDYANVTGDLRAEVAVGRFPARSATQVQVMVAKTLTYERTPDLTDSLWMRRLTTAVREDLDGNDTIYWNDMRHAATLAGAAGFVGCDSLSRVRGDDTADLYASMRRGTAFVMYRGSCAGNWASPFAIRPERTRNGNYLPVILSVTCATMSLDPYDSMVGEAWVKTTRADSFNGAVAFFGNSRVAHWVSRQRSAVARGFFTGLFTNGDYYLGQAMLAAKEHLYEQYPSEVDEYRGFNLFGDPGLRLWTATPKTLEVSCPDTIQLASQELTVAVTHAGAPVEAAVVCISMDSSVYVCDTTDAAGQATLVVAPSDTGRMRIVVTGLNLYPYEGSIVVVPSVGLGGNDALFAPAIRLTACPSIFRGQTTLRWGSPAQPGWSLTVTDVSGRELTRRCRLTGSQMRWGGTTRAGVFIATLRDERSRFIGSTRLTRPE